MFCDADTLWHLCLSQQLLKCCLVLQDFQGRRRGSPVGLSTMAQSVLGKPLNKAMQVSLCCVKAPHQQSSMKVRFIQSAEQLEAVYVLMWLLPYNQNVDM